MTTKPDAPPSPTTRELLECHRLLDSLALYVLRYTDCPDECFKAVELLQKQAERFGFPITLTFAPEHWTEQSKHAVGEAALRRRNRR